jgi:hypothetical protein
MKKLLFILFILVYSLTVWSSDIIVDGICYNVISKKFPQTVEVTKSKKYYSGDIFIPDIIDFKGRSYNVISIGKNAFRNCTNLDNIKLPKSLKSIKDFAFENCINLKFITLNEGLESVGFGAFYNCSSLDIFLNSTKIEWKEKCLYGVKSMNIHENLVFNTSNISLYDYLQLRSTSLSTDAFKTYITCIEFQDKDQNTFYGKLINDSCVNVFSVHFSKFHTSIVRSKSLSYEGAWVESSDEVENGVNIILPDLIHYNKILFCIVAKDYNSINKGREPIIGAFASIKRPTKQIVRLTFSKDFEENSFDLDTIIIHRNYYDQESISNLLNKFDEQNGIRKIITSPRLEDKTTKCIVFDEDTNVKSIVSDDYGITHLKIKGRNFGNYIKYIYNSYPNLELLDLEDAEIEEGWIEVSNSLKKLILPKNQFIVNTIVGNNNYLEELTLYARAGKCLVLSDQNFWLHGDPYYIYRFSVNGNAYKKEKFDKLIIPKSLSKINLVLDSVTTISFSNNKCLDTTFVKLSDLSIGELYDIDNALSHLDSDFKFKNIIMNKNGVAKIVSFADALTERNTIHLAIQKINLETHKNITIFETGKFTYNDLIQLGFHFHELDYLQPIEDMVKNDIWSYFPTLKKYDTELKKSNFKNTDEYFKLNTEFQNRKNLLNGSVKYIYLWPWKLSDYNLKTKTFNLQYSNFDEYETQTYPINLLSNGDSKFLFPSIPTKTISELISASLGPLAAKYNYSSSVNVNVDPMIAEKIEANKDSISILFIFKKIDSAKDYFFRGNYKFTYYTINEVRVLIVNWRNNEIYYNKLYSPVK